jgi:DNA-binding response OmpR family regulator
VQTRVLVVDDDPKIVSLLRRGLGFAGYVVDAAADGEAALAAARDRPPDVVVLDVMLPGVDGLEVSRRLRLGDASLPIARHHHRG